MAQIAPGSDQVDTAVPPRPVVRPTVGAAWLGWFRRRNAAATGTGMVENRPWLTVMTHLVLILGVLIVAFPVYVSFVASTHTLRDVVQAPMPLLPGDQLLTNYSRVLTAGATTMSTPLLQVLLNTAIMAFGITVGKIVISILSAFAIVYFRFPLRKFFFWMIFVTLMLPVEVRIFPTYKVAADLGLLNSYTGLILPLIASATATFLFRQFFMTVPDEMIEAARVDGAGPLRFFKDILLPLSATNIAALFVILFIYGWNQYLWPLLMTTDRSMNTVVLSLAQMIRLNDDVVEWQISMATAMLAMVPPVLVVVVMQRWFVKGLVDSEK